MKVARPSNRAGCFNLAWLNMAWNRPESDNQANDSLRRGRSPRPTVAVRSTIACSVVVLCMGIAAWILWPESAHDNDAASKRKGLIREVTPVLARTNETAAATPEKPKERPPQKFGEVRDGKILLADGELRVVKGEVTNRTAAAKSAYAIFDHPAENIISGLLSIKPGQAIYGTPNYNGRFTESFLRSIKEPIIVKSDDSPEDKALKRAVIDAKIELKAAYDHGEDIEKIIYDSRAEMQRLAAVRRDLKLQTIKLAYENAQTPEDVDDFLAAANKMLDEKGLAPLEKEPLTGIKHRLMNQLDNLQEGKKQ